MTVTTHPPPPRKVWATLITRPSYIAGLLVLYRTLVSVSDYPLIVLVTDTLEEEYRQVIRRFGLTIVDVTALSPPEERAKKFDQAFARFSEVWTKLQVFGLTDYERVILIDSDMIFLRPMDELFDMELPGNDWIAAAPACVCNPFKIAHYPSDWIPENCAHSKQTRPATLFSYPIPDPDGPRTSHLLNSGLVILQPSTQLMNEFNRHLQESPTISNATFADQDVITEVMHGRWQPLPWWTNALKTLRSAHSNLWQDKEVRLIHYILSKPWEQRPKHLGPRKPTSTQVTTKSITNSDHRRPLPASLVQLVGKTPPQTSPTEYDGVHAWWWTVYEDVLQEMQSQGEESGWRLVDAWVSWE